MSELLTVADQKGFNVVRPRFYILHPERGVYLGDGIWSKSPEAYTKDSLPTFNHVELAAIRGAGAMSGVDNTDEKVMFEIVSKLEIIDLPDNRISELNAVTYNIVAERWTS